MKGEMKGQGQLNEPSQPLFFGLYTILSWTPAGL